MATPVDTTVDTTEQFRAIFTSLEFPSYDDFNRKLEEFQQATGSLFRKFSTHALATENKKRRMQIPSHFQYASIKLCCVHYGQPRSRSTGMRTNQQYLAMGCNAIIALKFNETKNRLCVTSHQLVHTNHVLSPEYLPLYASRRQLNPDEMQKVEELVKLQPGNKQLRAYIQQEFNKQVTLRDIRNLKTRLKAGDDSMKALCETPGTLVTGAWPRALTSREKHRIAADITQRLQHILTNSGTEIFHHRVDWLERQIHNWQQELGDEMEWLDETAGPSTSHEVALDEAGPTVTTAFGYSVHYTEGGEDIINTSPSLPDDDPTSWSPEHLDHTYAWLHTTPPRSPEQPSSHRPVTVGEPVTPQATMEQNNGACTQPPASPRTPTAEETARSLLQLRGCLPVYTKQPEGPQGSKAWGAFSKNKQRGKRRKK